MVAGFVEVAENEDVRDCGGLQPSELFSAALQAGPRYESQHGSRGTSQIGDSLRVDNGSDGGTDVIRDEKRRKDS